MQKAQVQFLVRELRSYLPRGLFKRLNTHTLRRDYDETREGLISGRDLGCSEWFEQDHARLIAEGRSRGLPAQASFSSGIGGRLELNPLCALGKPGMLQSMELQRVRHDWTATIVLLKLITECVREGRCPVIASSVLMEKEHPYLLSKNKYVFLL